MAETRLDSLPKECLSLIISFTSPRDACRSSLVAEIFRHAADSDLAWEKFLPSDYRQIISASVSQVDFSSKKDLFRRLSSTRLLIDGGKKTFSIDKHTNKKCYTLSARELSITWSTNPLCWCWKHLLQSRFAQAVELIMVSWLEIKGKMNSRMLSANTSYGAYLVIQLVNRAYGLGDQPMEVSIEVGNYKSRGTIHLNSDASKNQELGGMLCTRGDGWLEVELGVFYNDGSEREVNMTFTEVNGQHLKGGLIVEGIELRPKH